ncbi:Uncharacterised protein [Mycobacteroides abscessus subsp. massiliense]|nr:Uncharacterised protein [Mycobacteroides abscessus subsp. massiliense]SLD38112.1 Uncharacterised protein [Mycobacteroides abscessus subsp. massiliense]
MSRWLVIRVREAKLAVKWHFELNPHTLIRLADHAVPADLVLAGFQRLFEISVISNRAGYHDWFIATQKLYSHLPSSPTHHVVEPVSVSFVRRLHSPCCVLHTQILSRRLAGLAAPSDWRLRTPAFDCKRWCGNGD